MDKRSKLIDLTINRTHFSILESVDVSEHTRYICQIQAMQCHLRMWESLDPIFRERYRCLYWMLQLRISNIFINNNWLGHEKTYLPITWTGGEFVEEKMISRWYFCANFSIIKTSKPFFVPILSNITNGMGSESNTFIRWLAFTSSRGYLEDATMVKHKLWIKIKNVGNIFGTSV